MTIGSNGMDAERLDMLEEELQVQLAKLIKCLNGVRVMKEKKYRRRRVRRSPWR